MKFIARIDKSFDSYRTIEVEIEAEDELKARTKAEQMADDLDWDAEELIIHPEGYDIEIYEPEDVSG